MSTPCSTGSSPYAKTTLVDLEVAVDPRQLVRFAPARWISGSSSRIAAIFTIAAAPDCSCP